MNELPDFAENGTFAGEEENVEAAVSFGRSRPPAASGIPYVKD